MGIINPRPAMRQAEARKITNQLAAHAQLMHLYIELGLTREEASKEAMQNLKDLANRGRKI
jgi:DNA-binding MurR/RpiR family transcriptional regulator